MHDIYIFLFRSGKFYVGQTSRGVEIRTNEHYAVDGNFADFVRVEPDVLYTLDNPREADFREAETIQCLKNLGCRVYNKNKAPGDWSLWDSPCFGDIVEFKDGPYEIAVPRELLKYFTNKGYVLDPHGYCRASCVNYKDTWQFARAWPVSTRVYDIFRKEGDSHLVEYFDWTLDF